MYPRGPCTPQKNGGRRVRQEINGRTVLGAFLILLGIASAVYGATIMAVRSGTRFFAVWYGIAAVALTCGAAAFALGWGNLPLPVHVVAYALIAVLAVVLALSILTAAVSKSSDPGDLDCIIVLGAQVRRRGVPCQALRHRLDTAVRYLAAHPACQAIVSGGQGPNEPCSEARAMANYLVKHGVERSRIMQEDRSTSTVENIRFSRPLIAGVKAAGLVTNDFHLPRALAIARKQGLALRGIAAPSHPWYLPNNLLRECLAIVKGIIRGTV